MFKASKLLVLVASLVLVLAPSISWGVNASASELTTDDPIEYYKENSEYFDISYEGDETTVTITDSDFKNLLDAKGIDSSFLFEKNAVMRSSSNGVTKIVWRGQARNGNVDLYLSKNWLNNMSKFGAGAAAAAVATILPGAGWSIALGGIGAVISGGNFQHGRVFVIRGFVYQYYYLQ
ncbi:hypothetical protein VBX93_002611 [Enterococcus faecalis]|uniref:hypothetical protein n=1 Tax=Enterococcus TaxID=1350 RepID=UPI0015719316|nr:MULTISPECIES: hypothetical protein [Enterococcus]EMC0740651.1 hypothetical protein [Enterococcus faecalis]MCD5156505.1 hypothetical protein [Enterococcus gallinarum]NSV26098.1 hypothetical protein [Enterococcus faecalis]QQU21471.1 hypothetical protein I6I78_17300 [Enterococcus casseliflavus]